MFSRQAPLLGESLFLSGMSPAVASTVQNLLGQCRAPLVHRGPITLDYTQPSMRKITPEIARHQFPSLRIPEPETFGPKDPEDETQEDPPTNPDTPFTPDEHYHTNIQNFSNNFANNFFFFNNGQSYFPGDYIDIDRNRNVHLKYRDNKRHCVYPTNLNALDIVHSVDFLTDVPYHKNFFQLDITDNPKDTTWKLTVSELQQIEVVTGVSLNLASKELSFDRKKVWVFKPEALPPYVIPLSDCPPPEMPPE